MIWDENIVYFFNQKKNRFCSNQKFVYLIFIYKLSWYHPKIIYEYIEQKDMYKFIMSFSSRWIVFEKNLLNKLGFNIQ